MRKLFIGLLLTSTAAFGNPPPPLVNPFVRDTPAIPDLPAPPRLPGMTGALRMDQAAAREATQPRDSRLELIQIPAIDERGATLRVQGNRAVNVVDGGTVALYGVLYRVSVRDGVVSLRVSTAEPKAAPVWVGTLGADRLAARGAGSGPVAPVLQGGAR